jgi:hypothetical protein
MGCFSLTVVLLLLAGAGEVSAPAAVDPDVDASVLGAGSLPVLLASLTGGAGITGSSETLLLLVLASGVEDAPASVLAASGAGELLSALGTAGGAAGAAGESVDAAAEVAALAPKAETSGTFLRSSRR